MGGRESRLLLKSRGTRGGGRPSLFWVKKEEITEKGKADKTSKANPSLHPALSLAQGLDPRRYCWWKEELSLKVMTIIMIFAFEKNKI